MARSTAATVAATRDRSQRSAGPRRPASGDPGRPGRDRRGPGAEHEPRGVPELVGEVAGVLELVRLNFWSMPGRRAVDEREAQGVRAGLVDDLERIDDVAGRLAHLRAVRVADRGRTGRPWGTARCPVSWMPEHHHPGDPEEDDVVGGLQDRARVVAPQVRRVVRPAEGRERPQPRAEPGVEDVRVLASAWRPACRRSRTRPGLGERAHGHVPVRAVPGRDAMAPPQLAAARSSRGCR